jgi:LytS/YehU family sensor histidine kinase
MLLQPLVENAIKHGLEPKIDGGEITVSAREKDHHLHIEISDTGIGFSQDENSGVGLRNVQERIKLIYGDSGHIVIEENKPAGVKVIIEIPKVAVAHEIHSNNCR